MTMMTMTSSETAMMRTKTSSRLVPIIMVTLQSCMLNMKMMELKNAIWVTKILRQTKVTKFRAISTIIDPQLIIQVQLRQTQPLICSRTQGSRATRSHSSRRLMTSRCRIKNLRVLRNKTTLSSSLKAVRKRLNNRTLRQTLTMMMEIARKKRRMMVELMERMM